MFTFILVIPAAQNLELSACRTDQTWFSLLLFGILPGSKYIIELTQDSATTIWSPIVIDDSCKQNARLAQGLGESIHLWTYVTGNLSFGPWVQMLQSRTCWVSTTFWVLSMGVFLGRGDALLHFDKECQAKAPDKMPKLQTNWSISSSLMAHGPSMISSVMCPLRRLALPLTRP